MKVSITQFLLALATSFAVSFAAGVGASLPLLRRRWIEGRLPAAAGFAAGVLIADACLHLIPESVEHGLPIEDAGPWLMAGVLLFFGVECVLRIAPRLLAAVDGGRYAVVARMDVVGDVAHHAMDGLLIGGAFLVGMPIGVLTAAAIALHEVVRKFGVSGVLLMSGMPSSRAMAIVWANTLACPLAAGVLLGLASNPHVLGPVLAAAAGGALYLACGDFLPSAWQASGIDRAPGIAAGVGLGIATIWACEALERLV